MSNLLDSISISRELNGIIKPLTQMATKLEKFIDKKEIKVETLQVAINDLEVEKKENITERKLADNVKAKIDNFFD